MPGEDSEPAAAAHLDSERSATQHDLEQLDEDSVGAVVPVLVRLLEHRRRRGHAGGVLVAGDLSEGVSR